jgi:hypothetical protein
MPAASPEPTTREHGTTIEQRSATTERRVGRLLVRRIGAGLAFAGPGLIAANAGQRRRRDRHLRLDWGEAIGAERSVGKRFGEAKLFLGLFTGQIAIGAAVALIPGNLIQLLVRAQVLNGAITPILLTYVLVLANRRTLLGAAANGPIFGVIATGSVAVIAIMAALVLAITLTGIGTS